MDRATEIELSDSTVLPHDHYQHTNEGTQLHDYGALTQTLLRENILSPFTLNANPYPQTRTDAYETPSAPVPFTSLGLQEQLDPLSAQESFGIPRQAPNHAVSPLILDSNISLAPGHLLARTHNPSCSILCQASKASAENEDGVQVEMESTNFCASDLKGAKVVKARRGNLLPHWLPITAETGKVGEKRAKSNYSRRRWDRIVKSRQEVKGRTSPCQIELRDMIIQLQEELGTEAEPLIVVEISTTVQKVGVLSEDEEVKEAGGRLYRCTQVTGEDGQLTASAVRLLTKCVQTNHNFKEFIHPLDDLFVRDAEAKAANLLERHPHLGAPVTEFKRMVRSFRREVADGNHFNEVAETCLIETTNKLWKELNKPVVPTEAAIPPTPLLVLPMLPVTPRGVGTGKRRRTKP